MTPLQLALTSEKEMDNYLENTTSKDIIKDILAYSNADRTVIATACLQGLISSNNNAGGASTFLPLSEQAELSVKYSDELIKALNKQH
jgi:hypothetical protein